MSYKSIGFALLLALLAVSALAQEPEVLAIVKANFEAADTDGNGTLSADEFPALIDANAAHNIGRAAMVKRMGFYDRAFATADKDGDGSVSWSDLIASKPR